MHAWALVWSTLKDFLTLSEGIIKRPLEERKASLGRGLRQWVPHTRIREDDGAT